MGVGGEGAWPLIMASGDHFGPPWGDLWNSWEGVGVTLGDPRATLGVLESGLGVTLGHFGVPLGGPGTLWGHFGIFPDFGTPSAE